MSFEYLWKKVKCKNWNILWVKYIKGFFNLLYNIA